MNIKQNTIFVNNLPVKIVRKAIKNLHLAVYPPDGHIRVAAPKILNDDAIKFAVISRWSWIKKHQTSFNNQERQSKRAFVSGESHYYLGKRYLLDVVYSNKKPSVKIKNKKTITLNVKKDSCQEVRGKILESWYRNELKILLPQIIKKWEDKTDLKVKEFGVRKMKTRWGSCNPKQKRIWLNLELVKKPINCLEYVVVNEMVHFLERKHNSNFTSHLDRILPNWKNFRDELNGSPLVA